MAGTAMSRALRNSLVAALILVGAHELYLSFAFWTLLPGGYERSLVERLQPFVCLAIVMVQVAAAAQLLRQSTNRSLWRVVPLVIIAVVVGAVSYSVLIWRGHWYQVMIGK